MRSSGFRVGLKASDKYPYWRLKRRHRNTGEGPMKTKVETGDNAAASKEHQEWSCLKGTRKDSFPEWGPC